MRVIHSVDEAREVCRMHGEDQSQTPGWMREQEQEQEQEDTYSPVDDERSDAPLSGQPGCLRIDIRSLRAKDAGACIDVAVELTDEARGLSEKKTVTILTQLFEDLHFTVGEISREDLSELEQAECLSRAVRRGASILACGTNSQQMLQQKLRSRGFDNEIARRATALLAEKGYIREHEDILREVERACAKGWGVRRIEQYLRRRGYMPGAVREAMGQLDPADFEERCAETAARYMAEPPEDAAQRQRLIAYLLRHGYEMSQIRYALKNAWRDGDSNGENSDSSAYGVR